MQIAQYGGTNFVTWDHQEHDGGTPFSARLAGVVNDILQSFMNLAVTCNKFKPSFTLCMKNLDTQKVYKRKDVEEGHQFKKVSKILAAEIIKHFLQKVSMGS